MPNPIKTIKRLVQKVPLLAFCAVVITRIIPGYLQYAKLVRRFGKDTQILRTAWHGTGDYYICGMYLQHYLITNQIDDFIFLVSDLGSEAKVMSLFNVFDGHTVKMRSIVQLSRFSEFMQDEKCRCKTFECSDQISFIGEMLKGYQGLTLMDFYQWYGFGFKKEPRKQEPIFSHDIEKIEALMHEHGLIPGKTVLMAPYSTCSELYLPPKSFWNALAGYLLRCGYTVATNCFGEEIAIKGTIPLSIDYIDIVPFLDFAGGFIGIRSGLCEIIANSVCNKIIIHTEKSDFWPDGKSEDFVGVGKMGLDMRAKELTFSDTKGETIKKIIEMIECW